jgi:putative holliday junction resolvase
MRYLGIDLGSKTVGLAISDTTLTIASSLKTIFFKDEDYLSTIDEIKNIIKEYDIQKIILGLPKNMNNTLGERAEITTKYKRILEENTNIPVIFFDERLTSVISNSILIEADISRKKRLELINILKQAKIQCESINSQKVLESEEELNSRPVSRILKI